jgi:hypothetical protein
MYRRTCGYEVAMTDERVQVLSTTFTIEEVRFMQVMLSMMLRGTKDFTIVARNPAIKTLGGKFHRLSQKADRILQERAKNDERLRRSA